MAGYTKKTLDDKDPDPDAEIYLSGTSE